MTHTPYHRFAITVPERLASKIEHACEVEGRNRSEFFREAVRFYFAAKEAKPQLLLPSSEEERADNPFLTFTEWDSEEDRIYDALR